MHQMVYFGNSYDVPCLKPVFDVKTQKSVAAMVTGAFKGTGVDEARLCEQSPTKIPLTQVGFDEIKAQNDQSRIGIFVRRLVAKLGGKTSLSDIELSSKAAGSFADLLHDLQATKQAWVTWDSDATCIVDKLAEKDAIEETIKTLCRNGCANIPDQCKGNIWDRANFVFGDHYAKVGRKDPLANCYFGGTATLTTAATENIYMFSHDDPSCLASAPIQTDSRNTTASASTTASPSTTASTSTRASPNKTNANWTIANKTKRVSMPNKTNAPKYLHG